MFLKSLGSSSDAHAMRPSTGINRTTTVHSGSGVSSRVSPLDCAQLTTVVTSIAGDIWPEHSEMSARHAPQFGSELQLFYCLSHRLQKDYITEQNSCRLWSKMTNSEVGQQTEIHTTDQSRPSSGADQASECVTQLSLRQIKCETDSVPL